MSIRTGQSEPLAILITRASTTGPWSATIVVDATGETIGVKGPSTSHGLTPAAALDQLLTRSLCSLNNSDVAASLISIEQLLETPAHETPARAVVLAS